ncbi:MAG TPA: AAA family ATPase, partial [Myxococcota bacterium]|nr:AAA family ATPase [Myxococcota bacterium]
MLRLLVEDLPRLLRRPISTPPRLEPHVAQARLFQSVEAVLRRLPQPALLVLEDLQWADPESLDLLRYLLRGVERSRVLLVATYRNDERPTLPRDLPSMFNLKLGRLDPGSVAALAQAMLGQAGARGDVLELLQREAEGHVCFIIETARALAEAAGGLDAIDPDQLPQSIVTGGMAALVRRCLQAVGARDMELLKAAAVAGRRLDEALLHELAAETDLGDWLLRLANSAVIDWHEGQWRFAHDKLREAVLTALDAQELERLHARVGDALERLHADNLAPYAPALAHHAFWARRYELATAYSVHAGDSADRGHADAAARLHYMYGLAALELIADTPASRRLRADIVVAYAQCAWTAEAPDLMYSRLESAQGLLVELVASGDAVHAHADRRRLAELELWKGRVLHVSGHGGRAIESYERTLHLAGDLADTDLQTLANVLIGQARMAQGYLREWRRIAQGLSYLRQHATFVDLTRALGYVGFGMSSEGRVSEGERSLQEAYALATAQNDDRAVAFAAVYYTLHCLNADDPEGAQRYARVVRQGARRSGDRILEFLGHGLQAWAEQRCGRADRAMSSMRA